MMAVVLIASVFVYYECTGDYDSDSDNADGDNYS